MKLDINPRYKDITAFQKETYPWQSSKPPAGKTELLIGSGDASDYGLNNDKMWNYLSEIAKDPESSTYSARFRPELINGVSQFEMKFRKVEAAPEHIIVGGGVAGCYFALHNVLLHPGDEVLIPTPSHYYWFPLTNVPYLGVTRVGSPKIEDEEWRLDLEDMRSRVTDKTKVIGITTPCNPTGRVYSEKELKGVVDIAGEFDIPVISDEIEGIIAFDGAESLSMARLANDVPCIIVNSLSKAFGSPGWACGYMYFHDPLDKLAEIEKTTRVLEYTYGHPGHRQSAPVIRTAAKAFEEGWWVPNIVEEVGKRREFAWKRFDAIEGISCVKSMGTFWLFPRVDEVGRGKTWETSEDFVTALWNEEGLGVNPGTPFGEGGQGHFRVTNLPTLDVLEDAYTRLEDFMSRHK